MRLMRFSQASLRTRLLLGMGIMLLPLVALGAGAVLSLQITTAAMDDVVEEGTQETPLVLRLQFLLQRATFEIHEFVFEGHEGSAPPGDFLQASQQADRIFAQALVGPFALADERRLLRSAQAEWTRAREIGERLLPLPLPAGKAGALQALKELHAHVNGALVMLDQVHTLAQGEMVGQLARAHRVRRMAVVIIATMFFGGLGAAILVGTALARSILHPVRVLEAGVHRIGTGDLSSRVSLATQDELGQLGKAFNAMAEKLAETQAALEDLSFHDGLTGLYNYREFQRRLAAEVERSWRYGRQFSLLFLDIDNFKGVNDTFGHLAGDAALRTLAAMVTREVRPADQLTRYGGDEFAIILPETPATGAQIAAERIRTSLVSQPIPIGGGREVNCTASIGVATYPEDGESGERLIAVADHALYAAKEAGGNRVMWAAPPPTPG